MPKLHDGREISPATLEKLRSTILKRFAAASYQDVGIRDICAEAGVSPKTVYKYFGNKDEMLFACIQDDLETLHLQCLQAARQYQQPLRQLSAFFECWCDYYFERKDVAAIVFLTIPQRYWVGERSFVQAPLHRVAQGMLSAGQREGSIADDIQADLLREWIVGLAHRAMIRFLSDAEVVPAEIKRALLIAIQRLASRSAAVQ